MSKVTIFSKAAFAFGDGATKSGVYGDTFVTVPNSFQEVDEKYLSDPTFILAQRYGEITIVRNGEENAIIADSIQKNLAKQETAEFDEETQFLNDLKLMRTAEVKELAEQYGAIFDEADTLKNNKSRVFEAYKLSISGSESEKSTEK